MGHWLSPWLTAQWPVYTSHSLPPMTPPLVPLHLLPHLLSPPGHSVFSPVASDPTLQASGWNCPRASHRCPSFSSVPESALCSSGPGDLPWHLGLSSHNLLLPPGHSGPPLSPALCPDLTHLEFLACLLVVGGRVLQQPPPHPMPASAAGPASRAGRWALLSHCYSSRI